MFIFILGNLKFDLKIMYLFLKLLRRIVNEF